MRRLLGILVLLMVPTSTHASSAPDAGRAFEPPAPPPARYAIQPPTVRIVEAADGTPLHTDTWLPGTMDGNAAPARVPVILVYTPYATKGAPDYHARIIERMVPLGYAVTFAHVRGTGGSGGCVRHLDANDVDDGARIVEDAGELAPWASGSVGMYGLSFPGHEIFATATGPDRRRLRSLKALIAGSPTVGRHDFLFSDGVPHLLQAPGSPLFVTLIAAHPENAPERLAERLECVDEVYPGFMDTSGDYTPFYAERDPTRYLDRLTAPLLMWHGSADTMVPPRVVIGLFDGLPRDTPRKGLFGVQDHQFPDDYTFNESAHTSPQYDWERADWHAMVTAWYERWLRGADNGVEDWPAAQVQGTDGQWRTASTWPRLPGAKASLALGPGATLGAPAPSGSTGYRETPAYAELHGFDDPPDVTAVFQTPPLAGRLELTGAPELDAWVVFEQPDSHVTARLEAVGEDGKRLTFQSRSVAARSARHLDPPVNGRFRQEQGRPVPVGTPVLMTLRFNPIDLVVPAGARLRLTLAGSSILWDGADTGYQGAGLILQGPSWPSYVDQKVTVLHSCTHHSVLRFTLPERSSRLLDVRERDQAGPLGQDPNAAAPPTDGGGVATSRSCGTPAATPHAIEIPSLRAVARLPSGRSCRSRRHFRIRLRHPRGTRIRSASVYVNGRRVATRRGRRVTARVNLRGLPRGRFKVRIKVTLADGRVIRGTRSYGTCRR